MADIYLWRQLLILCSSLFTSLSIGFMLGFPSVLNPAITAKNSTDISTTADHASWISAILGLGGLVGCFIMAAIMQIFGRKCSFISMNVAWFTGWIILIFAQNISSLYLARFIQGLGSGGTYIDTIIISEYVHPCRRGYFITLKKLFSAIAVLCCHGMSASMTWRQIAMFGAVQPLTAICLIFLWPESPTYLALKGRFVECEKSFKWLHGHSVESQKELKSLLQTRRENMQYNSGNNTIQKLKEIIFKKDFRQAFLISTALTVCIDVSGRYYYMAYITQIMTELIDNKTSALYFTIGADLLTITAIALSVVAVKFINRRTILFSTGGSSVLLMFLISVLAYLKTLFAFSAPMLWFIAMLIILQSFIVNVGIVPVAFAIISEIFSFEHRELGSFASGFIFTLLIGVILKITPMLMEHTNLYGTYSIFGVALAMCLVFVYKTVPETRDKTLQQIEDELNNVVRNDDVIVEREKLMGDTNI